MILMGWSSTITSIISFISIIPIALYGALCTGVMLRVQTWSTGNTSQLPCILTVLVIFFQEALSLMFIIPPDWANMGRYLWWRYSLITIRQVKKKGEMITRTRAWPTVWMKEIPGPSMQATRFLKIQASGI